MTTTAVNGELLISNARIRKAFERSGLSSSTVALRLGWHAKVDRPSFEVRGDTARLKRMLGICHVIDRDGTRRHQRMISERNAVAILTAMNVDPVDVGL
jgi:hypothetical protein